jgi:hypothetical protein
MNKDGLHATRRNQHFASQAEKRRWEMSQIKKELDTKKCPLCNQKPGECYPSCTETYSHD